MGKGISAALGWAVMTEVLVIGRSDDIKAIYTQANARWKNF